MRNRKIVLVLIIILLIIVLPLTIIGGINNKFSLKGENPDHEFKYNGYLYFYDSNNNLISKYKCSNDNCGYATPIIDDDNYAIDYYKEGTLKEIGMINNNYAFIKDGDIINLVNIKSGSKLQSYKAIKNYSTNLENNSYILKNTNDLWGVLTTEGLLGMKIPFEYNFIGITKDNYQNNVLNTKVFVTLKDNMWQLVNSDKVAISNSLRYPIVAYNNNCIVTKQNNIYHIYDYEQKEYLTNIEISDYYLVGDYIAVSNGKVLYLYKDIKDKLIKAVDISSATGKLKLQLVNKTIIVSANGQTISTFNID